MFGVPNLLNGAVKRTGITLLGRAVSALWDALFPSPTWGVFDAGTVTPAIEVSSVVELDLSSESRVSDYMIETGSFVSYNKVATPDIIALRITKDGGDTSRLQLLYWLNLAKNSTTLYDILTPEWRHPSMTLVGYRIPRSARSGAAMIIADTLWQEVREKQATYSRSNIGDPENQETTPTARAYPAPPDKPLDVGGPVSWQ